MDGFGVSGRAYSLIFALLAGGFIAASQVNVVLLRRWLERGAVPPLPGRPGGLRRGVPRRHVGRVPGPAWDAGRAVLLPVLRRGDEPERVGPGHRAVHPERGERSALLGFFQLGTGAVISTAIGAASPDDRVPIVAIFGVTAAIGLTILLAGRKRAEATPVTEVPLPPEAERDFGDDRPPRPKRDAARWGRGEFVGEASARARRRGRAPWRRGRRSRPGRARGRGERRERPRHRLRTRRSSGRRRPPRPWRTPGRRRPPSPRQTEQVEQVILVHHPRRFEPCFGIRSDPRRT